MTDLPVNYVPSQSGHVGAHNDANTQINTNTSDIATITARIAAGGVVLTGTGAPSSSSGSNGDVYFDFANGLAYGPKASDAWPAGVAIGGSGGGVTGLRPESGDFVMAGDVRAYDAYDYVDNTVTALTDTSGANSMTLYCCRWFRLVNSPRPVNVPVSTQFTSSPTGDAYDTVIAAWSTDNSGAIPLSEGSTAIGRAPELYNDDDPDWGGVYATGTSAFVISDPVDDEYWILVGLKAAVTAAGQVIMGVSFAGLPVPADGTSGQVLTHLNGSPGMYWADPPAGLTAPASFTYQSDAVAATAGSVETLLDMTGTLDDINIGTFQSGLAAYKATFTDTGTFTGLAFGSSSPILPKARLTVNVTGLNDGDVVRVMGDVNFPGLDVTYTHDAGLTSAAGATAGDATIQAPDFDLSPSLTTGQYDLLPVLHYKITSTSGTLTISATWEILANGLTPASSGDLPPAVTPSSLTGGNLVLEWTDGVPVLGWAVYVGLGPPGSGAPVQMNEWVANTQSHSPLTAQTQTVAVSGTASGTQYGVLVTPFAASYGGPPAFAELTA